MRKFKFRVWDKESKKFLKIGRGNNFDLIFSGKSWEAVADWENKTKIILQQFTGLFDKKGSEIYEGDIILSDKNQPYANTWEVIFSEGCFSLIDAKRNGDDYGVFTRAIRDVKNYEIVGNIFENPELLK